MNPIYGSVGLLWSGSWQLCQAAVEAVLKGAPIVQIPSETAASTSVPPLKAYDIRHIIKDAESATAAAAATPGCKPTAELHKVKKTRTRFKRSGAKKATPTDHPDSDRVFQRARSHESSGSHVAAPAESRENESMDRTSVDTVEASHVSQGEPAEDSGMELELTLGFEPAGRISVCRPVPVRATAAAPESWDDGSRRVDLGLELAC